jgi:hypothetical protein
MNESMNDLPFYGDNLPMNKKHVIGCQLKLISKLLLVLHRETG